MLPGFPHHQAAERGGGEIWTPAALPRFWLCPKGDSPREEAAGAAWGLPLLPALPAPGAAGDQLLIQHPVLLFELGCQLCTPHTPPWGTVRSLSPLKTGARGGENKFPTPLPPSEQRGSMGQGLKCPTPFL